MMAVPFLSMLSVPIDGDISATEGSGTADDPWSGYLTGEIRLISGTVYIEVGTEVYLKGGELAESAWTIENYESFGMTNESTWKVELSGTITNEGVTVARSVGGAYTAGIVFVPLGYTPSIPSPGIYPMDSDSSTENCPYIGVYSYDCNTITDKTIYVLRGSPIFFNAEAHISGDTSGLSGDGRVTGTLDGTGELYVTNDHGQTLTIVPIAPYSPLVFESDPSEGTIQFIGS